MSMFSFGQKWYETGVLASFDQNIFWMLLKVSALFCTLSAIEQSRDVAQLGSAPVLGTGGRRFESCHPENALSSVGRT